MIAEIRGKVNNINSNLTERSEDELTGNFFGNLRYLPIDTGLRHILTSCTYPAGLSAFDSLDAEMWPECISFWPREKEAEPDVLLSFDNTVIIIEVKYLSGLSSDDEIDNGADNCNREWEASRNQLAREEKLLERLSNGREKVLILLAPEAAAHQIYTDVVNRNLLRDVRFGYITWQKVFDALHTIPISSSFERTIVGDLIALMRKKGFERFKSFDNISCAIVEITEIWIFDSSDSISFSFIVGQVVERGIFYEFR